MKRFKIGMSCLAIIALLFTSCSKDEGVSPGDDPNVQSVDLTFGAALNDLVNRAAAVNKTHLSGIPDCSDTLPDYVELEISYDGQAAETMGVLTIDILTDGTDFFTAYSDLLKIPVADDDAVEVTLNSFKVFNDQAELIWIAPVDDDGDDVNDYEGYVDNPLPLEFLVRDGTKPYIDVEVLCYDRRMVNEYGYPFFELVPGKLYPVCFFANYCPSPDGRHYVGFYSIDISYKDESGQRISLYSTPQTPDVAADGSAADPLCLVIPESPFDDLDTEYIFYTVTPLDWPESYGDIDNTPLPEVGLSWNQIEEYLNDDGETVEYIHLFIGCDPPIDDCPLPPEIDGDGDCVPDDEDNCPEEPGTVGNFGCPDDECPGEDLDGDELFGECDRCPNEFGSEANFGCPLDDCTTDTDGDGVVDCDDDCPDVQGDEDNDGCPEDDSDETCETAFMFGDTAINSFSNANRWGWAEWFGNGDDLDSYPIYAGAGQNDVSKGTLIGQAVISIVDGNVNLSITLEDDVELEELHVNLSENKPSGNVAKAPGQYNMNDMVDEDTLEYTFDDFDFEGDDFWIIVHAVACYESDND